MRVVRRLILLICICAWHWVAAYTVTVENQTDTQYTAVLHLASLGPICAYTKEVTVPAGEQGSVDIGGCCLQGISLKDEPTHRTRTGDHMCQNWKCVIEPSKPRTRFDVTYTVKLIGQGV